MKISLLCASFIIILLMVLFPEPSLAADQSFNITANSGSIYPNDGNFVCNGCSLPLQVQSGDNISITFTVPSSDPYCCGIQVKGNNGQFDTGTIAPGGSSTISFTASTSFTFTSYWPGTGTVKATANVNVAIPPTPTPTTAPTTAPNMPTNTPQPTSAQPTGTPSNLPSTPTNLKARVVSSTQIELTWSAATGATSYQIYRNNKLVTTVSTLYFFDNGLTPATSYSYKILAVNNYGNSELTESVTAVTLSGSSTTPGVTETLTATLGPNETPTATAEPTLESGEIFVDATQNIIAINDKIYGYEYENVLNAGDPMIIYGRTVAFAEITVTVLSDPLEYTAEADDQGFWQVKVDTESLTAGDHNFTISIKDGQRISIQNPVSFTVLAGKPKMQGNNLIAVAVIAIGVVIIFGGFALLYFQLFKKLQPSHLEQKVSNLLPKNKPEETAPGKVLANPFKNPDNPK